MVANKLPQQRIVMTTHLEQRDEKLSHFIATPSRFPLDTVSPSLLSTIRSPIDGVVIVDALRQIVLVNRKAERLFGYPAPQLLEKPLELLLPPRTSGEPRHRPNYMRGLRMLGGRSRLELKGMHASGRTLSLKASFSRITVQGELFLMLVLHDTGIRKFPYKAFHRPTQIARIRERAVSSQQASEMEKRRFSKSLYDDIGQHLSVLKLDLEWLENSLASSNQCFPARLSQMQNLLDNVISTTKNIAAALRPPLLDDFGLMPALEWIVENFQKKTSIACTMESRGMTTKLAEPIESAIFRIIQEGLSNIERHSRARSAKIVILNTENLVDVMIQDDGIGLENGSENKPGCYGLIAMQERVYVLGGTISIRNVTRQGLAIHASIPIDPVINATSISQPPTRSL